MPRRRHSISPPARPARERWAVDARAALGHRSDAALEAMLPGPDAFDDRAFLERDGFPGQLPYTRGIYPTMYRGRLWTMRQYSGFGSARETNRRFRYLLEGGQTGLSVAFDLPTQIGYDPDHPLAHGEVGRCGVPVPHLPAMRALFLGLPLDRATISMTINATAPILLALLIAVAEETGVPRSGLGGTVQNDILKEYIARGTYIYPPAGSMRLTVDLIEFATREMPLWNSISVSGYHMREAGATAAQELAFTLANGLAYVEAVRERGLDLNEFLPRLSFFFSSDRNFLEEVAKFRAARRLWAAILPPRFGPLKSRSLQLRFHTQTAGSSLTAQQPELNVVRTTLGALAAVLGGTQSLHTNALDEAIGLPSASSARLALRTQQVLAEESGVANTVDPLAGAYAVEWATDRIVEEAEGYLGRIDALGGSLAAVEKGFFQAEIAREAYRRARALERRAEIVVGVNAFPESNPRFSLFSDEGRAGVRGQQISPADERRQIREVQRHRARRDGPKAHAALEALSLATPRGENVLPYVLSAVRAGATVGEIADVWRAIFGEQTPQRAF